VETPSLALDFCGLRFASPIVLLSGCVGFGEEYTRVEGFSNRHAGAIVLKGTTLAPRLGNPPHWEVEGTACFRHARRAGEILIVAAPAGDEGVPPMQQMTDVTDIPLTCGEPITS
jgi:hypothetical protein